MPLLDKRCRHGLARGDSGRISSIGNHCDCSWCPLGYCHWDQHAGPKQPSTHTSLSTRTPSRLCRWRRCALAPSNEAVCCARRPLGWLVWSSATIPSSPRRCKIHSMKYRPYHKVKPLVEGWHVVCQINISNTYRNIIGSARLEHLCVVGPS